MGVEGEEKREKGGGKGNFSTSPARRRERKRKEGRSHYLLGAVWTGREKGEG